jgi:hypothetical protein
LKIKELYQFFTPKLCPSVEDGLEGEKMKIKIVIIIIVCLLSIAGMLIFNLPTHADDKNKTISIWDDIPTGRLGYKLGTYLTIEGIRLEKGKVGVQTLSVDTINGKKIAPPIGIWVDNIESLPEAERCIIRGYESGKMIGIPDEVIEKENLSQSQAGWQFYRYFIVTSVVEPIDLQIKNF